MKRSIGLIVLIILIAGGIGYYAFNQYAQKKAEQNLNKFLKEANLENDVHYKSIKVHPFSQSIDINNIEWRLKEQGTQTGKVKIKRLTIAHFSKNKVNGYFTNAVLVNLDKEFPADLYNKPILEVEKGSFFYKKDNGLTKTSFEADKITLNKLLLKAKSTSPSDEKILELFKLNEPLYLLISASSDENKNTFAINKYTLNWQDNIKLDFSMYIANVDIKGLKNITKTLQTQTNNPLIILNYLTKLYEMKPEKIKLSIQNLGLVDRMINNLASEDNTTKQSLLQQVDLELSSTQFSQFKQPILNFLGGKNNSLVLEFENKNNLSIGDILQELQTQQLTNVITIKVSN